MSDDVLVHPEGKGNIENLEPRDLSVKQVLLADAQGEPRPRMTHAMPARRFWNDAWKSSSGSSSGRERGIASA
jgi:hypothetical protein